MFGDATAGSAEELAADWEAMKAAEKGRTSVFDGIPSSLPSLLYAAKVLRKAAALGVAAQPAAEGDVGAELLELVAAARAAEVDPEAALRAAADRLRARAAAVESASGQNRR